MGNTSSRDRAGVSEGQGASQPAAAAAAPRGMLKAIRTKLGAMDKQGHPDQQGHGLFDSPREAYTQRTAASDTQAAAAGKGSKQQPNGADGSSSTSSSGSASGPGAAFKRWAAAQAKQRGQSMAAFVQQACAAQPGASNACSGACGAPPAAAGAARGSSAPGTPATPPLGMQAVLDVVAAAAAGVGGGGGKGGAAGCGDAAQQLLPQLPPFTPYCGHASGAPKPHCHDARVVAANGINALRATRDGEIESMLRLLCKVFGVQTATVALLTGEAIYITGACGALEACVCPDRWGFCGWSFTNSTHELLVVEDMDADARFSANFFVVDPAFHLKFYVAAPLISANGHRLGTLCVMGQEAGTWDVTKGQVLANLAEMLVRQLEARWVAALAAQGASAAAAAPPPDARGRAGSTDSAAPAGTRLLGPLLRALSCYASGYLVLDLSARPWRVLHMNKAAVAATGVSWGASYAELANFQAGRRSPSVFEGSPLDTMFDASAARLTWTNPATWEFNITGLRLPGHRAGSTASSGTDGAPAAAAAAAAPAASTFSLVCRPAASDGLDDSQPFFIGVPSWLALSEANTWGRNLFLARLEAEPGEQAQAQAQQPQAQQQQREAPFAGDSVEQLTVLSGSGAAGGGAHGGAPVPPGAPAECVWLPRGLSAAAAAASAGATRRADAAAAAFAGGAGAGLSSSASLGTFSLTGSGSSGPAPGAASGRGAASAQQLGAAGAVIGTSGSSASGASSEQQQQQQRRGSMDSTASGSTASGAGRARACASTPRSSTATRASAGGSSAASGSCSSSLLLAGGLGRLVPIAGLVVGPLLGRGSYGRVYRGLLKGQPVAVKIIDDVSSLRLSASGEPLEVSLTRGLRQAGIMATLGYAYADAAASPAGARAPSRAAAPSRTCWMLFEYCNRGTLVDAVVRGWFRTRRCPLAGAPHLRVVALTALEVAAAMAHLHARRVMHGALCGGNVMLTASATNPHGFMARVGDFGLVRTCTGAGASAAAAGGGDAGNGSGAAAAAAAAAAPHPVDQRLAVNAYGTITHQPPEVLLEGGTAFTPAADVYAWGVLLWEMLTGSRAWAGLTAPAVVCQVAVLQRRLAVPDGLPLVLAQLLRGALDPRPAARPAFSAVVEQLTRFVQESRAVDWEAWQAAANAAHAAGMAAVQAADAAAGAAAAADAAAAAAEAAAVAVVV